MMRFVDGICDASQKRSHPRPRRALAAMVIALATTPLFAEVPGTAYIFPAGAQQGTTATVRIGGYFLHESAPLVITGPNVSASPKIVRTDKIWFEGPLIYQPASQGKEDYPSDYLGQITADAGASPGVRRWSVPTGQGVTPGQPFVIGRLPEVVEQETDGAPIPVAVTLPVTVNGRIFPRQDIDVWSFEVSAGQTVTCAVLAARIGSPLVSRLEIRDPSGKVLAEDLGSLGGDALVQFTASSAGRYAVHIHDAEFGGLQHYVYRLMITAGPFVNSVFPLGGKPGETLRAELRGANLPAAAAEIRLPDKPGEIYWWHPEGLAAGELGIPLHVADAAPLAEAEPNDLPEQMQSVVLPAEGSDKGVVLNGRIERPGDVDQFGIDAKQGVPVRLTVRAAALGSLLDSVLAVVGPNGQPVAQADDVNGSPDASLSFTPPADGRYVIVLKDRIAQRGGPDFAYRLHIAAGDEKLPVPFTLRIAADILNVDRGGQAAFKVDVQRFGFNDPIELSCEGLPAGVTLSGGSIAQGANQANLTFKAEAGTKIGLASVKIIGTAKRDGQEVRSVAALPAQPSEPARETIALSINVPTPFKIYGRFESKFSPRGSVYIRHYFIDRKGFEGPLEISLADRQNRHLQGVTGPKIIVPAGIDEFDFPLALSPRMELGRTSRTCLMAVGEVPVDDGTRVKVAYSSQEQSDQIIVLTAPERMEVSLSVNTMTALPGKESEIRVSLQRDGQLTHATKVELVSPPHLSLLTAEAVMVPASDSQGRLKLRFRDGPLGPINMPVTIRATTQDERGYPVIAEALLELVPATGAKSP